MLKVHHLGVSQSDRVVWLCEELELSYELVRYERDPVTRMAPPEYRALHPFGTAPVISDGELTLGESGAIVEYVIARHGDGRLAVPPNEPAFPNYLFWFHFANGSLQPSMMIDVVATMAGSQLDSDLATALRARSERAYRMVDDWLEGHDFFAGSQFSAADIMMLFPLTTMRTFAPRDLGPYPNLKRYLARIGERPAFRRAMAKADPGLIPLLS